jgi:hypothetical protein
MLVKELDDWEYGRSVGEVHDGGGQERWGTGKMDVLMLRIVHNL